MSRSHQQHFPPAQPPDNHHQHHDAPTPNPHVLNRGRGDFHIGSDGFVRTRQEVREKLRREGLCEYCGVTRTHSKILGKKLNVPKKVYKGYCLKCYDEEKVRLFFKQTEGVQEMEDEPKNGNRPSMTEDEKNGGLATSQESAADVAFVSKKPISFKGTISRFSKPHHDDTNQNDSSDTSGKSRLAEDHDDDQNNNNFISSRSFAVNPTKSNAYITEENKRSIKMKFRIPGKHRKKNSKGRGLIQDIEAAKQLLPINIRTSSKGAPDGVTDDANNEEFNNSFNNSFSTLPMDPQQGEHQQEQKHEKGQVKPSSMRSPLDSRRLAKLLNYSRRSEPSSLTEGDNTSTHDQHTFESPGARSLPVKFPRYGSGTIESIADFAPFPELVGANEFQSEERPDISSSNDGISDASSERNNHERKYVHNDEKESSAEDGDDDIKADNDRRGEGGNDEDNNEHTEGGNEDFSSFPSLQLSSKSLSPSSSLSAAASKEATAPTENEEAAITIISQQIEKNDFRGALETIRKHVDSPSVVQFGLSAFRCKIPQAHAHIIQAKSLSSSSVVMEDEMKKQAIQPQNLLPPSWIDLVATSIMYRYKLSPLIQSEAIQTMWIILSLNARYKKDVIINGGVDAVIKALDNFSNQIDLVEYGTGLLSCLLCDDNERNRMAVVRCIQAKGFESRIVRLLERCTTRDGKVEEWIVRVLYGFFLSPVNSDESGSSFKKLLEKEKNEKRQKIEHWRNLPGTILGVMSKHKSNPGIQLWSCRLMWVLLEELTTEEAKQGGIHPLDCSTPPEQVRTSITTTASGAVEFYGFLDAITVVADAMSSYGDDAFLHEAACGFFHLLTKVFSSSVVGGCAEIMSSPLLLSSMQIQTITESIVNSMVYHSALSIIQIYGCRIISNLCSCTHGDDTEDVCAMVVQLGGVNSILQSMQHHSENISLQAESCGAIASLCEGAGWIIGSILDLGGVDVMVNGLRLNKRDALSGEDKLNFLEQVCAMILALSANTKCVITVKQFSGIVDDLSNLVDSNGNVGICILERLMMITTNLISDSGDESCELATDAVHLAVTMMKTSTSEEGVVYAIQFLHLMASSMDYCIDVILTGGVREQILDSMHYNPDSTAIQEASCSLISLVYAKVYDGTISTHETADEIAAVRSAMRGHRKQESLQGAACLALRNFCSALGNSNDRIVAELSASMDDVILASRTHPKSSVVQENVCGALSALSTISDMALSVASSGGIQLIIGAMNEFPGLLSLQNDACNTLLILTSQKENFEAIGTELGIDAIVRCFDGDMAMSEKVCSIIAALSSGEYQVKLNIIEHEIAVNRVIECMFRFPGSSHIQMAGSEIIFNISVDEYIIADIAGLAGIGCLKTAMTQHLDDPLVQEKACKAMAILIPFVDDEILMGNHVGRCVYESMQRHPENDKIQIEGIGALCSLSKKSRDNKEAVAQLGGIIVIINSMVQHLGSIFVQEKGLIALCSLGVLRANKVEIGNGGGIQAIINGMKEHRMSEKIQIGALEAMRQLSPIDANRVRIVNLGGVDSIVESMRVYNTNESIQHNALLTLSSISAESQYQENRIATSTELDAVVDVMRKFPQSEKVQLNACKLLRNYTLAPANVELMRQNEILPVLVQSATANFPSVVEQAQYLIGLF